MIKKFRALIFSLSASLMLLVPAIAMPVLVHADSSSLGNGLSCGTELTVQTGSSCADQGPDAQSSVQNIITLVINIFSLIVGIIAVIMIIIGGIKYITSGGDSNNVTSAKNTILYAIIGLVIVALAQILVRYVLARVNNATGSS